MKTILLNQPPQINRKLKKLPEIPGVYFFKKDKEFLYIGKAANLKNRIKSYFANNLEGKTLQMINFADRISFIKVTSELDALLLEAKLIRKNQPKYNSISKDDKHPLYIKISSDKYPKITTARKIDEDKNTLSFYGPFPSSTKVNSVLRMVRKIFPYADHNIGKKACLYSQIGLCRPCPSLIDKETDKTKKGKLRKKYLENIRYIKKLLSGRSFSVKKELERKMQAHAVKENFEEAASILRQIESLDYITQPIQNPIDYLENPNLYEDVRDKELKNLLQIIKTYLPSLNKLERIECFDVAHLSGIATTASMITFIKGEAEKSLYRRFKIRQTQTKSDLASLKEVAQRRLKNIDKWGKPDLIIVDGGKTQTKVFFEVFSSSKIAVIGLAKREETLIIPVKTDEKINYLTLKLKPSPAKNLAQRIRNEAHRFARKYHHFLIKKMLITKD